MTQRILKLDLEWQHLSWRNRLYLALIMARITLACINPLMVGSKVRLSLHQDVGLKA